MCLFVNLYIDHVAIQSNGLDIWVDLGLRFLLYTRISNLHAKSGSVIARKTRGPTDISFFILRP